MREWLEKLLLACVAVLAPIHAVIITVFVLVIADMITGIWAAKKQGQEVNSASMRRSVSKLFIFEVVIIAAFLVEQFLIGGLFPATKIVAGAIGLVELKSILENANIIAGEDIFKMVLQRIGSENDLKQIVNQNLDKKN